MIRPKGHKLLKMKVSIRTTIILSHLNALTTFT